MLACGAGLPFPLEDSWRIYHNEEWTGWHAGTRSLPAELREGRKTVVIETGEPFFLSVTDKDDW